MPEYYDLHAHPDPDAVVPDGPVSQSEQATSDGPAADAVLGRILCGTGPADWDAVAAAARWWPGTVPAFGVHPWHFHEVEKTPSWRDELARRLEAHPGAWLGEAGLDCYRQGLPDIEAQREMLAAQLELAVALDRPVNLHCVKAWEELVATLDSAYLRGDPRLFIIHSFAGPYQMVDILAERGAFFTQGPLQSRRDNRKARERAARIPEDRMLLESDAFLISGRDDPAALADTLTWLADVRNMPAADLAAVINENSRRLLV
ncbi:MAG: TatD family hydrolase [Planctomycetes bacterium]|nr:TatD family hydrolase [Planctomycetota bacterium]